MKISELFQHLALVCWAVALEPSRAQGTAFAYQGRLNNGGTPANGTFDLAFTLFDADQPGGNLLVGSVTNSAVAVSNGLFATAVDFGNVFTGTSNWLEIAVSTNGANSFATLAPRQQLTPVPYALVAADVSGPIAASALPAVVVTNGASGLTLGGAFSGDGSGLSSVNAYSVNGLTTDSLWKVGGNTAANPTNGAFLGTTDNLPLEFKVNGSRVLRLESNGADLGYGSGSISPNLIGGYAGNLVDQGIHGATILGGGAQSQPNHVSASYSVVLGGTGNRASGYLSTASGNGVTASGGASTALGGGTTASGDESFAVGSYTVASGWDSVALGDNSTASGDRSFAAGELCTAGGEDATAMGGQARAAHDHSFVWSDGTLFPSTAANQFMVHASGGLQLFGGGLAVSGASSPNYAGAQGVFIESQGTYGSVFAFDYANSHTLPLRLNAPGGNVGVGTVAPTHLFQVGNAYCDGNTWAPSSDRNVKAGFQSVDAQKVLAKVAALPITSWHYTNDVATPHVGPMAQDFYAAFQIGADDKHITTTDEGGVALAAIQGLNQKMEAEAKGKDAEISELKARLDHLEKLLDQRIK